MKKFFTLSLALALCSSVYADEIKMLSLGMGTPGLDEPQLVGFSISPNGKYVCGILEWGMGYFIAESETGDIKWKFADSDDAEIRHVDDYGLSVGYDGNDGISFNYSNEEVKSLKPSNYKAAICEDLTDNGNLVVGSMSEQSFITYAGYTKDKGANWIPLVSPAAEDMGAFAPKAKGSAAKFVSADGKIIYGCLGSFTVPCAWKLNDKGEYEPDFFIGRFGKKEEADRNDPNKPIWGASALRGMAMSKNGKYIACVCIIENETSGGYRNVIGIYKPEENTMTLYTEPQPIDEDNVGLFVTAIADDGTFVGSIGQPDGGSYGSFIMKAGQKIAEKFVDVFPAYKEVLGISDSIGYTLPTGISSDGNYIVGYSYYCTDYYDIDADAYHATYVLNTAPGAGVDEIAAGLEEATPVAIYTLDGKRVNEMTKGINIVRMSDGTSRKVIRK